MWVGERGGKGVIKEMRSVGCPRWVHSTCFSLCVFMLKLLGVYKSRKV